jgi:hypothetical protein
MVLGEAGVGMGTDGLGHPIVGQVLPQHPNDKRDYILVNDSFDIVGIKGIGATERPRGHLGTWLQG